MSDAPCPSQKKALEELEELAPGAPLLALGQSVFWDEPMKAGIALAVREHGFDRRFIAGVHDTDYFGKTPLRSRGDGHQALPHNDTTTKGLWSAAGEVSRLFGSETVITRDHLQQAGAKVGKIAHERPELLDSATEAWGWRGVVDTRSQSEIVAEKPLNRVFPKMYETVEWAVRSSLENLAPKSSEAGKSRGDELLNAVCDSRENVKTLGGWFEALLPAMFAFGAGEQFPIETTATTKLLAFNPDTSTSPRFDLLGLFLNPETREQAEDAYNQAVGGSEIYTLDRFGTAALPFDVYIPGTGRGTLHLGRRGGVIDAPHPVGFSFKKAPETPLALAQMLESRFGEGVVLIGKAVSLIGMLAREFVFVFHEGASGYVWRSRQMHQALAKAGLPLDLNPILRIKYNPWKALKEVDAWLRLPEPLREPFGATDLCAASLSRRLPDVQESQSERLEALAKLRRPRDLVDWLATEIGGEWQAAAKEEQELHETFQALRAQLARLKEQKADALAQIKRRKRAVQSAQDAKGIHWRTTIWEKSPTEADQATREKLTYAVDQAMLRVRQAENAWQDLQDQQDCLVTASELMQARERRRRISLEAELARVELIRQAVIATEGLELAGRRPAAWWFPLVSPDGTWFAKTICKAQCRLEPLT